MVPSQVLLSTTSNSRIDWGFHFRLVLSGGRGLSLSLATNAGDKVSRCRSGVARSVRASRGRLSPEGDRVPVVALLSQVESLYRWYFRPSDTFPAPLQRPISAPYPSPAQPCQPVQCKYISLVSQSSLKRAVRTPVLAISPAWTQSPCCAPIIYASPTWQTAHTGGSLWSKWCGSVSLVKWSGSDMGDAIRKRGADSCGSPIGRQPGEPGPAQGGCERQPSRDPLTTTHVFETAHRGEGGARGRGRQAGVTPQLLSCRRSLLKWVQCRCL